MLRAVSAVPVVIVMLAAVACGGDQAKPPVTAASVSPTPSPTPTPTATPTPTPLSRGAEIAQLLAGSYAGTWNNTTFGSTGPLKAVVAVDAAGTTISVTTTLGGQVFGAAAPAPETLSAPVPAGQPPFTLSVRSAWLGDVTLTLSLEGLTAKISADAPNVPSDRASRLQASGTNTSATTLAGTYTVTLRNGTSANGTWTVTKQP